MIVHVSRDSVHVEDADVLTALSLTTSTTEPDTGRSLIDAGLARDPAVIREPGLALAWLHIERLRALAMEALKNPDPDWPRRWTSMIAFAGEHGWVSADGTAVRVHLDEG